MSELNGWMRARPIRVAFLVSGGEHGDLVLDGIFADCYARWGGRFSLVVPCLDGDINSDFWPWLEAFDPDIVYAYVDLQFNAILQVHERLAPADYIRHEQGPNPRMDLHGFKPRYRFEPLSSSSTLFRLARHSPGVNSGPRVKVINSWHTETPTRFLLDNFGSFGASAGRSMYPNDARAVADLLTIVSNKHFDNRTLGVPRDLDRVPDERAAFSEFAHGRATSLSLLSTLDASRLEVRDHKWSEAFNLVVGDSFDDRLLFWNARLLIPSWLDGHLSCLRISMASLDDGEFVALLVKMLNGSNRVNGGSGGSSRLCVRSSSYSTDELGNVVGVLRAAKLWGEIQPPQHVSGGRVLPSEEALEYAREVVDASDSHLRASWREFHWTPPIARPGLLEPAHLADAPPRQAFVRGLWATDLSFEHGSDPPRMAQANVWMLSKRWRMAEAFRLSRSERGFTGQLPPAIRRCRGGNLTAFTGVDQAIESVTVPSVGDAVYWALCRDGFFERTESNDPPWPRPKAIWTRPSSESPHLTGVLGLAGGLRNARRLLLQPFLRQFFASLGGASSVAEERLRDIENALVKLARKNPAFDLAMEGERATLAALVARTAQSLKQPKSFVELRELRDRWSDSRKAFWAAQSEAERGPQLDGADWETREERALDVCLREMRSRRLIFQGFPWTCQTCLHRNWTDFQVLRPILPCEVCSAEFELPVEIPWSFRANEFLIESLRARSVLSLIWVLSALQDRARQSFVYLGPTELGFSREFERADAEVDLFALVDGEAILCEVKTTWRGVRDADIEDFVALAIRLRPDKAIFAVMDEGSRSGKKFAAAKAELAAAGIRFEMLTAQNYRVPDDPHLSG